MNRWLRRVSFVVVFLVLVISAAGLAGGCRSAPDIPPDALGNVLYMDEEGRARDPRRPEHKLTTAEYAAQIEQILDAVDARPAEANCKRKLLIFVHGGLVTREAALERAVAQREDIIKGGYYPVFVNWNAGLPSSYWEHLLFVRQGRRDRTTSIAGPLTMPFYLIADLGRAITRAPVVWLHQFETDSQTVAAGMASLDGKEYWTADKRLHNVQLYFQELERRRKAGPVPNPDADVDGGPATIDPIQVYQGEERMTRDAWLAAGAGYVLTLPFKLLLSTMIDGLGKPAWENMSRRTATLFESQRYFDVRDRARGKTDEEVAAMVGELLDYGPRGGLQTFLAELKQRAGDYEITLIGHSMGTMVLNQLVRRNPDLPVKNIVYMAAACSIHEFQKSVLPYLERHPEARFYNLCLHPTAELIERNYGDLPPRGSLLVWIDDFLADPQTPLDRTLGRWENVVPATYIIPKELRGRVTIKCFGKEPSDRNMAGNPQKHGGFSTQDYWDEDFWKVEAETASVIFEKIEDIKVQMKRETPRQQAE